MAAPELRAAQDGDFAAIVALNAGEVQQTSAMDVARLAELHALAAYHKVVVVEGVVAAFLLALREDAPYRNDNHGWFAARYPRFLYVDRIVVGPAGAGLGLGSLLYRDLFDTARSDGVATVCCEYNIEPPNEASRRFHDKFGFREVGSQWLDGGKKRVSLQIAEA
jgi:predicted GNAT superfamily acetyltransferase